MTLKLKKINLLLYHIMMKLSLKNYIMLPLLFLAFLVSCQIDSSTEPDITTQYVDSSTDSRPDIILIMADDMGFSDLGSYGSEIDTPNLDMLAENGIRFREFYNAARCVPTRGALLTGRYPHNAGLGGMTSDRGYPGYRGDLNRESVTLAEALRINDYHTYMSGKWHVTKHNAAGGAPVDQRYNWPLQRGFDRFFGTILGAGSLYGPHTLTKGNRNIDEGRKFPGSVWLPSPEPELPVIDNGNFYYTDAISETSVSFIREHHERHKDKPFFLYVSHVAPHWPLHAPREDIEPYMEVYSDGWDEIRQRRFERMAAMGLIDEKWELPARPEGLPAWDELRFEDLPDEAREAIMAHDLDYREELILRMATHAAMVERMDRGVGDIIKEVKATGRFENTLIMFLVDNGAAEEVGTYGFGWSRLKENGVRIGEPQSYASYGAAWAHVSNAPLRFWKAYAHEGGIASPFIAHWPDGIKVSGGMSNQVGHIIDVMPTIMDITGSTYPKQYAGYQIESYDGVSLVPAFRNESIDRNEPLFFEHGGRRAIRNGRWKLVSSGRGADGIWKLYDMKNDRTETRDLSGQHPGRVQELAAKWQHWAENSKVLPMIPDQ